MVTQETIVINAGFEERQRTTSNGTKSRYTLSVSSEPVFHRFDPTKLGEGPALAIRAAIADGIKAISTSASPGTILRRKSAERAIERGAPHAVRRYSGGRTGSTTPGRSDKLFNDSLRLVEGLFVRQNPAENNWTINVPANRLDPSTFKERSDFIAMVDRLRDLVPALRNPLSLPAVKRAIDASIDELLQNERDRTSQLRLELIRQAVSFL